MAKAPGNDASESPKYKTWVLKVSIDCEGCKKKVQKVLHNIDGIFRTTVDPEQHTVSFTGNVDPETVIKKLVKAGKHAELRQPFNQEKKPSKSKKNKSQKENEDGENAIDDEKKSSSPVKDGSKLEGKGNQEGQSEDIVEKTMVEEKGGSGGKKKKKKGQRSNAGSGGAETENGGDVLASGGSPLSAPQPNSPPYPQVYFYHPMPEYGMSYNASYPSTGYFPYYEPHMLAYPYPHYYAPLPPPPPFNPIANLNDHDDYDYDDDESGCRVM